MLPCVRDYTQGFGRRIASAFNADQLRSRAIYAAKRRSSAIYTRRIGKYPELRALVEHFSASRSLAVNAGDMLHLYETVIERRPRYLLDLGAGTSTNIIALAIQTLSADPNYKAVFVAIEESADWLAYHRDTFVPELRQYVQLLHAPAQRRRMHGIDTAHYSAIPDHPYEFVHVDGPSLTAQSVAVSSDVLTLRYGDRAVVIFDEREASARFAIAHLPDGFRAERHPWIWNHRLVRGG